MAVRPRASSAGLLFSHKVWIVMPGILFCYALPCMLSMLLCGMMFRAMLFSAILLYTPCMFCGTVPCMPHMLFGDKLGCIPKASFHAFVFIMLRIFCPVYYGRLCVLSAF